LKSWEIRHTGRGGRLSRPQAAGKTGGGGQARFVRSDMKIKCFVYRSIETVLVLLLGATLGIVGFNHKIFFRSPLEFDQKGTNWRAFYDGGGDCIKGAELIEGYLKIKYLSLTPDQRVRLHFHAAQMFACGGMTSQAMAHLDKAQGSFMSRDWNNMVAATRAFLLHDRTQLLAARDRLVAAVSPDDSIEEADMLVEHFGDSYGDMRWWARIAPTIAIPTNAPPEQRAAAEKLAAAFGLSVTVADTKPAHCIWVELRSWDPSLANWKGFNYWDGFIILHFHSGTVITASSRRWLDEAVERFIKSSREHNGAREAPTGLTTSFPLARS
jgi:hypothetical protein